MNKRLTMGTAILAAGVLALSGCATDEFGNQRPMTDAEKGVLIGGLGGATIGALATKKHGKGALIGAVGGGIAGGLVGNYMDSQKKDFEKQLQPEINAGVVRVQKLPEDQLLVGMTGATAFETNSDVIQPGFYSTLDKIANILNRYGKTQLVIVGHTDSVGSDQYNQQLSERRAGAVNQYLLNKAVVPQRLSAYGRGKLEPIASNASEVGRQQNRRVDITIIPVVAN